MAKRQKDFPVWASLLAPVLLVMAVSMFLIGGQEQQAAQQQRVQAGLDYLEALEKKSPAPVIETRKQLYRSDIRTQRESLIKSLEEGTRDPFSLYRDYCLVGDSRAVGYWYHGYLDDGRCFTDGSTLRDLHGCMDALASVNPATVYLCYGLNDVSSGYWDSADAYVGEYMQSVRQLQTRLPGVNVVVSSILAVQPSAVGTVPGLEKIGQWNDALKKACEENHIPFADCSSLAELGSGFWESDGIHFRAEFYPYWASRLLITALEGEANEK